MTPRAGFLCFVFFLSGAAGLAYEIVWARMFAVGLGHEFPSVLAVVAAFFGGFALGAWGLDRIVSQTGNPARWYAIIEVVIGLWALSTIVLIPIANEQVAILTGVMPSAARHWIVAFGLPFIVLLPATAAMGATLATMDRLFSRIAQDERSIGILYAANTLGAVFGTIVATFVFAPAIGLRTTVLVLAAVNALCAALVLLADSKHAAIDAGGIEIFDDPPSALRRNATIFTTGLLGVAYEVLGIRVLGQVLENTVYTFASVLSVYLLGTAVGASLYHAFVRRTRSYERVLSKLLLGLIVSCTFGVAVMAQAGLRYAQLWKVLGGGFLGSIGAEMAVAFAVFGLPTVIMGAVFSHLALAARGRTGGIGQALALNTLGASLAPPIFVVMLVPEVGPKWSLIAAAFAYLLLVPFSRMRSVAPCAIVCIALAAWTADLRLIKPPPGGRTVENGYREGVLTSAAVVEDSARHLWLKMNDRFSEGGTASIFAERREAHIPLLLHPAPRRALFLGIGAGITLGATVDHPNLVADGVELIPEVIDLLPHFSLANRDALTRANVNILVADARRYVKSSNQQYDVIVADLFHPARDGAGSLYTVEHFNAIRTRLSPDGLFCQWLPLYQHDVHTFRTILRTFLSVFPETHAVLAHFNVATPAIALIGGKNSIQIVEGWMSRRVTDFRLGRSLRELELTDDLSLFGSLLADPAMLTAFAGPGNLNIDDRPIVTFDAPRHTYEGRDLPFETFRALLDWIEANGNDGIAAADDEFHRRLRTYVRSRNLYLRGEMDRLVGNDEQAIEKHLSSAGMSADFRTAYDMLLEHARRSISTRPMEARRILTELQQVRPERTEATQLLNTFRE